MATLTVTLRGQVTFRKDVLQHLGIKPGGKIELDLLPGGRGVLKAARPQGAIDGFVGLLAGRTTKVASIGDERGYRAGLGGQAVKVTADTRVLVRAVVRDDPVQAEAAATLLTDRVRGSKRYALDDPLLGLGTSPVGKRVPLGFAKMDVWIDTGR